MKKVIQIVSFLAIALSFASIDASAQNKTKIDANVPFDFVIGDHTFAAGKYTLLVNTAPSGAVSVEVRDSSFDIVYQSFALTNGEHPKGKAHFTFDRSEPIARLVEVQTGEKGFSFVDGREGNGLTLASRKKAGSKTARN